MKDKVSFLSFTHKYIKNNLDAAAAAAKSLQSCLTLCDPIDGSPPDSAIPGILQARTLEWVAISFSNALKWKVKGKSLSHARLIATPWTAAYQAPLSMGFSRQEYWSGVLHQSNQRVTEDEMVGWPHWFNGHKPGQIPGDSEGQGSLVCLSPWGRRVGHDLASEQQQKSDLISSKVSTANTWIHLKVLGCVA